MIPKYLLPLFLVIGTVQARTAREDVDLLHQGMLNSEALDELRGTPPEGRAAYLSSIGLTGDNWCPRFERAADDVLAKLAEPSRPTARSWAEFKDGMLLAALLHEERASSTLKRILQSPRIVEGEGITYLALIALSELGTDDAFLVARIGDSDPRMARLAILAAALRSDESIVAALEVVKKTRGNEAPIEQAFQFLEMLRHTINQYVEHQSLADRLTIVEQQVARGFNPVNGITLHGDPLRADGPATRWAFERWRELASQYPEQVLEFIRKESPYETMDLNAGYRRYLARHGGAQILARLGDGK